MTLALIVWLVMTVLPSLKVLGCVILAASCIGLFIFGMMKAVDEVDGPWSWLTKQFKWAIPVMLLALFTPSKETAWYMVGAYATQTVVQSDTAKELASDSVDVLKSLIKKSKEYIDADQAKELDKAAQASPKLKQERT